MRYYARSSTIESQAGQVSIRAVMDAPDGGSQIGVAFVYGVMPNPGHWYRIVLRGTELPTLVPGKFRLVDGEFGLIPGTEGE
jgi:hypothetical protein